MIYHTEKVITAAIAKRRMSPTVRFETLDLGAVEEVGREAMSDRECPFVVDIIM
jgi:hypothetical protein